MIFAHCGVVGPLMANAILNFHFDFLTTSLIKNDLMIPESLTILQLLQMEVWTLMVEKSWTLIFPSWIVLRIAIKQFCEMFMKLCFRMSNFNAIAIAYT